MSARNSRIACRHSRLVEGGAVAPVLDHEHVQVRPAAAHLVEGRGREQIGECAAQHEDRDPREPVEQGPRTRDRGRVDRLHPAARSRGRGPAGSCPARTRGTARGRRANHSSSERPGTADSATCAELRGRVGPRRHRRQLPDVALDPGEARGFELGPDVVEHDAGDALGARRADVHGDGPAHRGADEAGPRRRRPVEHGHDVGGVHVGSVRGAGRVVRRRARGRGCPGRSRAGRVRAPRRARRSRGGCG